MDKKKWALTGFVIGVLLTYLVLRINFDLLEYIQRENLSSNIIDFIGNIMVALTSAAIAWFVSKNQNKKNQMSIEAKTKRESRSTLKLLKTEITINKKKVDNLLGNLEGKTVDMIRKDHDSIVKELELLRDSVWSNNYQKLSIEDTILEKFHNYYIYLNEIRYLSSEEIAENNFKRLRDLSNKSGQAVEVINVLLD